jgi:tRNA(fMet)-specific endonuclease VapC
MEKYLIDTNCLIYHFFKPQIDFENWFATLDNSQIVLCDFMIFELYYGLMLRSNQKVIKFLFKILSELNCYQYTTNDAILSANNKIKLKIQGKQLHSLDLHISSIAINNDLTLVTFNTKDYIDIPNLKTKNFSYSN